MRVKARRIVCISLLIMACVSPTAHGADLHTKVVVSVAPLLEMARAVGGSDVSVQVLLPSNKSPDYYRPSPIALKRLSQADLFVSVGLLGFEQANWRALSQARQNKPSLTLANEVPNYTIIYGHNPHHHHDESANHNPHQADPYIWLDPVLMEYIAEAYAKSIMALHPKSESAIRQRLDAYKQDLDQLHNKIKDILNGHQYEYFISYKPTYTYFAKRYQLVQRTIEHNGDEPPVSHLTGLQVLAKQKGIRTVIIEPYSRNHLAKRFARNIGTEVDVINALSPNYSQTLLKLARAIAEPKFR